jgi:hypothetical protein
MEENDPKKPRERSREYPQYDLKFCIELTETINSKLGNRYSSAEQLSKTFNKSITYLGSQLSSCKQYNLLDLKKGEGYKPTEFFYKVTRGRTDADKLDASIYCLKSPSIYNDFIEKYNGQEIPSDLPSIFYWDYKITEAAKDSAAKIFVENLNYLNLISEDGILQVGEQKAVEDREITLPLTIKQAEKIGIQALSHQPQPSPKVIEPNPGYKRADIKVSNGRYVTLDFPFDISSDEIDKLIRNLELWKD